MAGTIRHFGKIRELLAKVRALNGQVMLYQVLQDPWMQREIIDFNMQEQLYELGVDAKGVTLGQYAYSTIHKWKPLAEAEGRDGRTDHVTLKDTGDFYASAKINLEPAQFTIEADTLKPGGTDLARVYGKDILGLTRENIGNLIADIRPLVQKKTRTALAR